MARGRLLAFLTVAIGFTAGLIASEIGIRVLVQRSVWDFAYANDYVQPDALLGWVNKPDVGIQTWDDEGRLVEFRTNGHSLLPAGARPEKSAGVIRILALGDSTTLGRSLPEPDRLHRQLERALREAGVAAEVLNGGVEGYATDQALIRLEQLASIYAPDIVIHVVCEDDVLQNGIGVDSGLSKPRFELVDDETLELHLPHDYEQHRFLSHSGLADWIQYSALYRVIRPALTRLRAGIGRWDRRNLLGISDQLYYSSTALEKRDWRLFEALLTRMNASSRRLYVALHPALEEVWEPFIDNTIRIAGIREETYDRYALERKVGGIAQRHGISFVPQIDHFRQHSGEGPFHLLPRDPHSNAAGYRLTAQNLAARIVADLETGR
jgi:hypothetical protein